MVTCPHCGKQTNEKGPNYCKSRKYPYGTILVACDKSTWRCTSCRTVFCDEHGREYQWNRSPY